MADETRNTDNQNSWKPRTLKQSGGLASSTTRKIVRRLQTTADRTMVGPWKSPLRRPERQKAALREHVEHSHEFAHRVRMRHRGRNAEPQAASGQAELTLAQSMLDAAPGKENVVRGPSIFTAGQAIPPVGGSLPRAEAPSPAQSSSTSSSNQSTMGPGTVILPMAKRAQASAHKETQPRRPVHRPGSRIFSRVQEGKAAPETQASASESIAKDTDAQRSRPMEHQDSTESPREAQANESVDEQAGQADVIQRRADASSAQRSMRTEVPSAESETPNAPTATQTPIQRKSDSSSTTESASALPTEPKSEPKNLDPRAIWAARDKAGATAPPVSSSSTAEMPIQRKVEDQSATTEPTPEGLAPIAGQPMAEHPVERLSQSSQSEETSSRPSGRSISVQSSRTTPEAPTKAPRRLGELITGSNPVAEQSGTTEAEAKPILTPTESSLSTPADMPVIQAKRERSEVDHPSGSELSSGDSIEGATSQQVRSEQVTQEKALQAPREATSRSTTAKAAPSSLQPTPHSEAAMQRKAAPEQTKNEQRVDQEHITLPEPAKPEQRVEESSSPSTQAATPIAADEPLPESNQSAKVSREDMPLRQRSVAPSPPQPDKTAQSAAESTEAVRPERLSAPESKVASSEPAQPPAAAPAFMQEQPIQRKPADQEIDRPSVEATGSKAVEGEIPAKSIEPKQPGKALEQGSAKTESESASSEMPLAIQRKAISTPKSQMPTAPVEMSKPSSISSEQLHGETETESSKASTAQASQRAPQSTTEARQPSSADTRAVAKDEKNVEAKTSAIVSPTQSDMPLVHKPSSRQRWAPQITPTPTPQPSVAPEQPIQRKTAEPLVESRPVEDRTVEPRTSGHPVQDRTVKETTAPSSEPQVERLASDETSRSKSPTHQPVVAPPEMVLSKTPTRQTDLDSKKAEAQSVEEPKQESKPVSVPVPFVPRTSRRAKEQARKLATKVASANTERSAKTGYLGPTEELVQRITDRHKYSTESNASEAVKNLGRTSSTRRKSDGESNARSGRVFGAMPLVQLPKVNKEERERPEFKSRGVAHNLSAHATQQVIQRKAAPAAEVDNGDEIDYADLARRVYPHLKRMLVIEKERRPGGR